MIEFKFITTAQYIDDISNQLDALGVAAITQQDAGNEPIYEPRPGEVIHWQSMQVSALVEHEDLVPEIQHCLFQLEKAGKVSSLHKVTVPEEDWVTLTQMQTEPMSIGSRLYITPNWLPTVDDKINVIFNPGHAFGTGSHPTTWLCLEWLEANICGGETLLDYGCGSGILAIAAIKLGAKHATAVDYDPQALDATRANATLNTISSNQLNILSPHQLNGMQTDIVVANIISKTLIELSETLISLVKKNGRLVLSGILDYQVDETVNAFEKGLTLKRVDKKNEWARIEFVK